MRPGKCWANFFISNFLKHGWDRNEEWGSNKAFGPQYNAVRIRARCSGLRQPLMYRWYRAKTNTQAINKPKEQTLPTLIPPSLILWLTGIFENEHKTSQNLKKSIS